MIQPFPGQERLQHDLRREVLLVTAFPKLLKIPSNTCIFLSLIAALAVLRVGLTRTWGTMQHCAKCLSMQERVKIFEGAVKDVEVSGIYGDDINFDELRAQLLLLPSLACDGSNLLELTKWFRNCGEARSLLPAIENLLALILTLPATNAVSERSFSGLRRVKTYLRSSMLQLRLNNVMICHVHKDICDKLDNKCIVKEFVESKPNRALLFNA